MEGLEEKIKKQLRKIEEQIETKSKKEKIDVEKRELDRLLEEYVKHI